MPKKALVAGILALWAVSILPAGGQVVNRAAAAPPAAKGILSDAEILKILKKRIDVEHRGVGIVIGIVSPQSRKIIGYGRIDGNDPRPLNGDTVFEIGSITKVFTSLLLCDMVRRGEVALNDPVSKYLPNGVKVPEWKGRFIKLIDLATQTSGLPFFPTDCPLIDDPITDAPAFARYSVDQVYKFLSGYELLHDIGIRWEYSNLGVGLLGLALSSRAGMDYESLVRARITGPLGMASTSIGVSASMKFRLSPGHQKNRQPAPETWFSEAFAAAGSLRSTANDLLTLLNAFLAPTTTELAPAMALMLETQRTSDDWLGWLGGRQALGWWVFGKGDDTMIAHAGDTLGFTCSAAYDPKAGIGVIALCNASAGGDDLAMHLLRPSYPLSQPSAPQTNKEILVDPAQFDRCAGKYQVAPNVIFVIRRENDKLSFMAPGSPRVRLYAESERDYFIRDSEVRITFQADARGRISGLILKLGAIPIPAKKIGT